jgi:hypothetical protein
VLKRTVSNRSTLYAPQPGGPSQGGAGGLLSRAGSCGNDSVVRLVCLQVHLNQVSVLTRLISVWSRVVPLVAFCNDPAAEPTKEHFKQLRDACTSRDDLNECLHCIFSSMQTRNGITLDSKDASHANFESNLGKSIRCDGQGVHDITLGDGISLASLCKQTLVFISDVRLRLKERWTKILQDICALITASCPPWIGHEDVLCSFPPSPIAKALILNPVYAQLGDQSDVASRSYEACRPVQGFSLIDSELLSQLQDLSYHATCTVSITFVCFHLYRVFPQQKGSLMLKTAASTLIGQLTAKGTFKLLPPSMQNCIDRVKETGELPKPDPPAAAASA